MKKLLFITTLLLMFSMSVYAQYEKENLDEIYADRTKILKANNFVGYKGKAKLKVNYYDEGYTVYSEDYAEAGNDNIDKVYDTYIDASDENNISIIFSKSKHNKELKINIRANKMTFFYEGKEILVNDNQTLEKAAKDIPLYKYPYSIVGELFSYFYNLDYYKEKGYDIKATHVISNIIDIKSKAEYYIEEIKMRIANKNYEYDDYNYNVGFNDNYEIEATYIGDNGEGYTWENGAIVSISKGTMMEVIEIEFFEPKGWIKK